MGVGSLPEELGRQLSNVAGELGVRLTDEALEGLWVAAQLLAEIARASGISGYERPEDALIRGLAPGISYLAFKEAPREGSIVDLGAGNGALGAAIALLCPGARVFLMDRAMRAYTACELLIRRLRLDNAEAVLKEAGRDGGEAASCDSVVFRALAPGPEAMSIAAAMTHPDGFIAAWHKAGDVTFATADQPENRAFRYRGTVSTTVEGLVVSGFIATHTGSPQ
ncbi:MAG: class I SAM-dependent methyltransferase [Armatimonadetes bacterium]|nr:class I SAM-dependent methyltransferase [Armatimonadota bacterium]